MCGIAGIVKYKDNPIENIEAMNRRIHRRGPDAGGHWLCENDRIVLGHRRLSIVDLSECGAQPMVSASERYVIVYNGEIYNAPEIKKQMEETFGAEPYRGTSDTEVLLRAIEHYGLKETLVMSRGMFALAVYDRQEKVLQLARDRMGEKPLYYGLVNGSFVFASGINAIKAVRGFHNPIEERALGGYFVNGYIPAPYSIYRDIYKLEQGSILTIKAPFEQWQIEKYYDITETAIKGQENLFDGSEKEAVDELEKILKQTIKGQMMADVPLGAFLSGGIDSTLVVSLMQSVSEIPVRTFTIGFEEEKYNEAAYAKETAKHLGTQHTEMYVGYEDVINLLPSLPEAYGEPFADSSQLPTMLVSKMTRDHVTVSLSGDAGDEFFCGYNSYKDIRNGLEVMRGKLPFIKDPIRKPFGELLLNTCASNISALRKAGNCFTVNTPEELYRLIIDSDNRVKKLLGKSWKNAFATPDDTYPDGLLNGAENNLMLMNMRQYLPDDILVKVDRAGMFYSLETRIPLLDADVMNFAWRLPLSYKMQDGITKKPLRELLYRYVPKEMMDRPKKGFSVPVSLWLKDGKMREWAESVLTDAQSLAGEFINTKTVQDVWKDYIQNGNWNSMIWYILMFEQWILHESGK